MSFKLGILYFNLSRSAVSLETGKNFCFRHFMQEQHLFPPITFFSSDKQTCYLLQQSLQSLANVSFVQEDILDIKNCDCVIFPCYTSFGFSNVVNDQFEKYSLRKVFVNFFRHLGNTLTSKITKKIKSKYHGEQLPGSSFIVSVDESVITNTRFLIC